MLLLLLLFGCIESSSGLRIDANTRSPQEVSKDEAIEMNVNEVYVLQSETQQQSQMRSTDEQQEAYYDYIKTN